MATAWFICTYKRAMVWDKVNGVWVNMQPPARYCAMDDFTPQINADGGAWSEIEVSGGYAVVKVRASSATLTTIGGTAGFTRVPVTAPTLSTTLSTLTSEQRNALLTLIGNMGYTPAEISAALGSTLATWRGHTLGNVLRFIASKRLKPRYDRNNDQIVLDGVPQACRSVSEADTDVN